MILGIPSTGSAGLIQTVSMFSQGHIAAGVLGTFASAGWIVQGFGNGFFYRTVSIWIKSSLTLVNPSVSDAQPSVDLESS